MCTICDTLRNDADTGDECVECGAVYLDQGRRESHAYTGPVLAPKVGARPTSSQVRPHQRLGWYRNIQMSGGRGLDKRSARR